MNACETEREVDKTIEPAEAANDNGGRLPAHAQHVDQVLAQHETDPTRGLTGGQARDRLEAHGPNRLDEPPPSPWWRRLTRQFRDLVIMVLLAAAVISAITGDLIDAAAILAIVVINGLLGFFQEERAGRALASLRKLAAPHA